MLLAAPALNTTLRSWAKIYNRFCTVARISWLANAGMVARRGLALTLHLHVAFGPTSGRMSRDYFLRSLTRRECLQLISTHAPACALLIASRLVHLEPSCCTWCREWGQTLRIAFTVMPWAKTNGCVHIWIFLLAQTFAPHRELANVKRAVARGVIGAPSNEAWLPTPRGPSLRAIILPGATLVLLPLA